MAWDNWHLEDIHGHDLANLKKLLERKRYEHKFEKVHQAMMASGFLLDKALSKHGISLSMAAQIANGDDEAAGHALDQLMKENNVRVEQRMEYTDIDQWRCGLYIYKNNEIADFIGAPTRLERQNIIHKYRYQIVATVDLDG